MADPPIENARSTFADAFSSDVTPKIALAPGRVNLIGEHTDYNAGYVLPMAIDKHVAVAFTARNDDLVYAHSAVNGETRLARISELRAPGGNQWFDYVAGVVWSMLESGMKVSGLDIAVAGNVPVGAGLASSAAFELAVARAVSYASGSAWDPVRFASICQYAENVYVGVNCGIMDQFAASVAFEGAALLLDCRSLEHEAVPIPTDATFVVMDTGVRRKLAASEYNDRRKSCEVAVAVCNRLDPTVQSLRDVTTSALANAASSMPGMALRRAKHVISEIDRPVLMRDALATADLYRAGQLMNESHASLRDLYEVSCTELDTITEIARGHNACYGARMTGAGFGGCAVALVDKSKVNEFASQAADEYRAAGFSDGAFEVCLPSAGARILS